MTAHEFYKEFREKRLGDLREKYGEMGVPLFELEDFEQAMEEYADKKGEFYLGLIRKLDSDNDKLRKQLAFYADQNQNQ